MARKWGEGDHAGRQSFRLGEVDVSPDSGTVSGPGGTRQLDPKVMQVLLRLVAAGGDVVSREDLMADVWQGTIVTDFALSRCVYQLRKNLRRVAQSSDSPIDTLPKRGYRLTWAVSGSPAGTAQPVRARRSAFLLFATLVLVAGIAAVWWYRTTTATPPWDRPTVAVLPFYDLTKGGELGYFGDGVAQALMTELGGTTALDVIARTSSFHFRGREADVRQIAEALDVDYLVEGSVNSDGDAIQVGAALVDAASGRQVWAGTFEGMAGQSFTAQQDIANAIAGHLEISVGDPRSHGGTTVFEAYDAYLKAFDAIDTDRDDGGGDIFLDQALAYDPDFAQALEAKAFFIYLRLWQGDGVVEEAWSEARQYLERALELHEHSAVAHGTIAGFQILRGEYEAAEASLRQALEINPSDSWALVHLSRLMEHSGRLDEAVQLARHNVRLDPLNSFRHLQLANRLWTAGDYDSATASFERTLELDPLNYAGWRDYCLRLANRDGALAGFRLLARLQQNPDFRAQFLGPQPLVAPAGIGMIALWLGHIEDYEREFELLQLQSRMGESAELHRELARLFLTREEMDRAREEAWLALNGMPRNDITNWQVATIALRSGEGIEPVQAHYRAYWPGLYQTPPSTEGSSAPTLISAALVARALGDEVRAEMLLDALIADESAERSFRAMALAHSGDLTAALDALEAHVEDDGHFSYLPGDPFWAPLVGQPRFDAIVADEAAADAYVREQVALMIDRGELLLPGGQ